MSPNGLVRVQLSQKDRAQWNAFDAQAPSGHLMQSCEWGAFKAASGWQVRRITVECEGRIVAGAQMLFRALPMLPLTIAYIPKGPIVDLQDDGIVEELFSAIHQTARSQHAIFLRIEPNMPNDDNVHKALKRLGFRYSIYTNQPRSTIVVSLPDDDDMVLANIPRKKTRKLIRQAARKGVEIVAGGSQDIGDFYEVLKSTAEIKNIPVHGKMFYEQAWKAFQDTGSVKLLLAKYQGETVAGKMIFVFGGKSMHFWGGTCPKGREVYASYLIQWEALKWAASRGCKSIDLWGIPDEIGDMLKKGQDIPQDRQDGLWGVYTFKRGFGGEIESYVGAYDYVYRPFLYQLGMMVLARNASVDSISRFLERLSRR